MKEFPYVDTGLAKTIQDDAATQVKVVMHDICESPIKLNAVVAGGLHKWLVTSAEAFSDVAVDDETLRNMFRYFVAQADTDPAGKLAELLKAQEN
jgi:hypothetical protein